jgi:hypothetical protein
MLATNYGCVRVLREAGRRRPDGVSVGEGSAYTARLGEPNARDASKVHTPARNGDAALLSKAQMDVWIYILLHDEVLWQTRIALTAHDDMQAALRSNDRPRFWYATQAFLSAAANVSKLLGTPKSKDAAAERAALRARLRVSDDSLLLDRELRNHFEHYDTRIIELAQEHPDDAGVGDHIGHPDDFGEYGRFLLRCFDPKEQQFWLRGKPFALRPWVEALRDIRALAQERRLY